MTGTSSVLVLCAPAGIIEPALIAMPHALPGLNLLLGAMVASGASLALMAAHALVSGTDLPAPEGIFPRYVEPVEPGQG